MPYQPDDQRIVAPGERAAHGFDRGAERRQRSHGAVPDAGVGGHIEGGDVADGQFPLKTVPSVRPEAYSARATGG